MLGEMWQHHIVYQCEITECAKDALHKLFAACSLHHTLTTSAPMPSSIIIQTGTLDTAGVRTFRSTRNHVRMKKSLWEAILDKLSESVRWLTAVMQIMWWSRKLYGFQNFFPSRHDLVSSHNSCSIMMSSLTNFYRTLRYTMRSYMFFFENKNKMSRIYTALNGSCQHYFAALI